MAGAPFTYDLTTDVGKVRLLVQDHDETAGAAHDFNNDEIEYVITLEARLGLLGAAARLYSILAGNAGKLAVKKDRLGLSDDLTQIGVQHRKQADAWRMEAEEEAEGVAAAVFVSPSYTVPAYARNLALDGLTVDNVAQEKGP